MRGYRLYFYGIILFCLCINKNALGQAAQPVTIDFSNKIVLLDKGWTFYWGKTYHDICTDSTVLAQGRPITVPGNWNALNLPKYGFGTYLIRLVKHQQEDKHLVLKLYAIGTNYNLYVNGQLHSSVGVFAKNEENSKPEFRPQTVYFDIISDTIEIALEVSNYNYREGGIWYTPSIAKASLMGNNSKQKLIMFSFLTGALFVLFCYFIAFYYIKTNEKTSLYFALLCLFSSLRIASTGEIIFRQFNFPISWEMMVKTEFISLVLMLLFGIHYLCSMFKRDINQRVLKIITFLNIVFALFFLFSPVKVSSEIIPYHLVFNAILLLYILNILIKVLIHKRRYSILVFSGYLIVFVTGLNDILYSQGYISTLFVLPAEIFFFAFIQGFTLTKKFSNVFAEVEDLSVALKEINKNQASILEEKTAQLNIQSDDLKILNITKDKVFSIIAHDLRAPVQSLGSVLKWVAEDDISFEDLKNALKNIRNNVVALNLTLENLLIWSRGQLNGIQSSPELLDFRTSANNVIDLYKIQTGDKNIALNSHITDRTLVYIDNNHLNLVLRNLVSNAIKFTNPGGKITISSRYTDEDSIEFCIEDNGVGISSEVLNKIFVTGEHYTSYGTKNEKGTGLGLKLRKEYVEQNQGKLWLESEVGVGTKAYFTIKSNP